MDSLTREPAAPLARTRPRRWGIVLLCLLVLLGIGYTIWFWPGGSADQAARGRTANQPIPVLVAPAEQKDVPIYLDGLGTVQAFNTVTVKAMVDGPLNTVNFKEGQDVKRGDVLAQIDPRSYQAALDQAVAKQAQDAVKGIRTITPPTSLHWVGGSSASFVDQRDSILKHMPFALGLIGLDRRRRERARGL